MIERVPSIDPANLEGETISNVRGELEFKDIHYAYPLRPESLVLRKFNLKVMACQTVGLVGGSGSGKSTVINLLERFYDPLEGEILLDGINIKALQLKWLGSQMGLVSQEPILFATSIKENIQFGRKESSLDEIVQAAKAANAHTFISELPDGYETLVSTNSCSLFDRSHFLAAATSVTSGFYSIITRNKLVTFFCIFQVGQLGIQMSEGQKQRISIARAILREPRNLPLDEATSSLDSQSEKAVQDALNQASVGRTTIIIAHRLSTLRDADFIAVIQSGQVVESDSHEQLIQNINGQYSVMVQLQKTLVNNETVSSSEGTESNISLSPIKDSQVAETKNKLIPSLTSPKKQTNQEAEEQQCTPSSWQLIRMTASELNSALLGCIGAHCYGLIQPLHSFCMGALLSVYFLNDHNEIKSQTSLLLCFLSLCCLCFITNVIQHYNFGVMGENFTKKVKGVIFTKILTFEMEWFDQEYNSSGALCSRLSTDGTMVRTLVADRLAFFTRSISAATLAVILGLVLAWKLALVGIALQPLIILAFYVKAVMMRSMSRKILTAQNKSSELASEAVGNHRIITAFYTQEKVMELFKDAQKGPRSESHKQS